MLGIGLREAFNVFMMFTLVSPGNAAANLGFCYIWFMSEWLDTRK